MSQTFYQILGLDPKAEDVVIKAAYKALAQKYHPDKAKGNKDKATQLIVRLNTAYQTLMDANSRLKYDQKLEQINKTRQDASPNASKAQPSTQPSQHSQPPTKPNPHHAARQHHSSSHENNAPHSHKSKGRFDVDLINKILSNQVDEIEMVNLFEKLYQTSLVIHHGFANTYSFIQEGQRYKHDFSSLKKVILHKLEHESKVH